MAKVYSLSIRNRAAATVFGVAILGLGAVFLTLGFALLMGLVAVGVVAGAGLTGYRMIRGGPRVRRDDRVEQQLDSGLDPSLEVRGPIKAIVRPRQEDDQA